MGYFKDALKGVSWMTAFRGLYRAIGLIRISIVAHLLTPLALGAFGIVSLVLAFLEILTETGINIFLIQEKNDATEYFNTAWVLSIFRGLAISLLIVMTVSPISIFFNSPDSKTLLYLAALVPFIRGLINPAIVNYQKDLHFHKEFIYRLSVFFVECLISVLMVIYTKSAIGLVWGMVASAFFEVIYTFVFVKTWPKFKLDIPKATRIIKRGRWVTLFGIFEYLYTQSDNIIVGKMLGVAPLGIYQNAYKISTAPLTEVGDIFFRVTFPVFSKISTEAVRLKTAFVKNTLVNFILMGTAGVLIYFFASPIVLILLGSGWESAVPVVKLLSILGVARGVAGSTNSLLVAKEKQKYSAIVTLVSTLGLWLSIVPLINHYGIIGAGMAAIIGTAISLPFTVYFVQKSIKE